MLHPTKRMFGRRESRLEICYSKYYIVQFQKNQGCSLKNFINIQICQNTKNVHIQPTIVPRLYTAPKIEMPRNKRSSNGRMIMHTPQFYQDASSGKHTCLPCASYSDILPYNRSKCQVSCCS